MELPKIGDKYYYYSTDGVKLVKVVATDHNDSRHNVAIRPEGSRACDTLWLSLEQFNQSCRHAENDYLTTSELLNEDNMKEISRETNRYFDWLLEDESNVCDSNGNSEMIRVLVKRQNAIVRELCKGESKASKDSVKEVLGIAAAAIYFNDNSDYLPSLYLIVSELTGIAEPTEEDIKQLFNKYKQR